IPFWWAEKTKYWSKTAVPVTPDIAADPVKLGTLKLDPWKFRADRDDKIHADERWTAAGFNDSAWDTLGTGPWNSLRADLQDYSGVGLYRATFEIPRQWTGSAISLNLYGNLQPCVFGTPTFYLNGKKLEDAAFLNDLGHPIHSPAKTSLDRLLVPGKNVLAVEIKGGAEWAKSTFSGFGGTVYLSETKPLAPTVALGAGWQLVQSDGKSAATALPLAKAKGQYLVRDFDLPTAWSHRSVYLRIDTATIWLHAIRINDKFITAPSFRGFGKNEALNITPYIVPGKACRIELWGRSFPGMGDPKSIPAATELNLLQAEIGCQK
ncbi:MAG: hypothetical protein WCI73_04675, partial [Phycisphaerae bacterium]